MVVDEWIQSWAFRGIQLPHYYSLRNFSFHQVDWNVPCSFFHWTTEWNGRKMSLSSIRCNWMSSYGQNQVTTNCTFTAQSTNPWKLLSYTPLIVLSRSTIIQPAQACSKRTFLMVCICECICRGWKRKITKQGNYHLLSETINILNGLSVIELSLARPFSWLAWYGIFLEESFSEAGETKN